MFLNFGFAIALRHTAAENNKRVKVSGQTMGLICGRLGGGRRTFWVGLQQPAPDVLTRMLRRGFTCCLHVIACAGGGQHVRHAFCGASSMCPYAVSLGRGNKHQFLGCVRALGLRHLHGTLFADRRAAGSAESGVCARS